MAIKASNHRVMVTLTRDQDELLTELGGFQSRSKGSYLRELVDGAEPMLRALLPLLRAHAATVQAQPGAIRDVVAQVLTGAFGGDPDQLDFLRTLIDVEAQRSGAAGVTTGDGSARTAATSRSEERTGSSPPSSNTGVRNSGPRAELARKAQQNQAVR